MTISIEIFHPTPGLNWSNFTHFGDLSALAMLIDGSFTEVGGRKATLVSNSDPSYTAVVKGRFFKNAAGELEDFSARTITIKHDDTAIQFWSELDWAGNHINRFEDANSSAANEYLYRQPFKFTLSGTTQEALLVMTSFANDTVINTRTGKKQDIQLFTYNGDDTIDLTSMHRKATSYVGAGPDDDKIFGGAAKDLINGEDGKDLIFGGDGRDNLNGGAGSDRVYGGNANDSLRGDRGDDRLFGGFGNDSIWDTSGASFVKSHTGNDSITALGTVFGGQGNDSIAGAGVLWGGSGDDYIELETDDLDFQGYEHLKSGSRLYGQQGDDVLFGSGSLYGGGGNDRLTGDGLLIGGKGKDYLQGNGRLEGGHGNDELRGDGTLTGGNGSDKLWGDGTLTGGNGNDELRGDGILTGGDGNDELRGDGTLTGGSGDDVLWGGGTLTGGDGNDRVEGFGNLFGGSGDDKLRAVTELTPKQLKAYAGTPFTIDGGEGNDKLTGSFTKNFTHILRGGLGNDTLDTHTYNGVDIFDFRLNGDDGFGNDRMDFLFDASFGTLKLDKDQLMFDIGTDVSLRHNAADDSLTLVASQGGDVIGRLRIEGTVFASELDTYREILPDYLMFA